MKNELQALRMLFKLTDYNSNKTKYVLWVVLAVWGIGAIGMLFGHVIIDTPEAQRLWELLTGVVLYFLGRAHGVEVKELQ